MKSAIRYVELKTGYADNGPAFIARVRFSKTGRTIYFHDRVLKRLPKGGISGNHVDEETGEEYWVSGVKADRADRHWAGSGTVSIDEDAREEYESIIRQKTGSSHSQPE